MIADYGAADIVTTDCFTGVDANFLIPEVIESLHYVKGPYHAELGDFSSAGGVHINTFHRAPDNRLQLEMGEDNYQRLLAMGGATVAGQQLPLSKVSISMDRGRISTAMPKS